MKFSELIDGKFHSFYGSDNTEFKIGRNVFEAMEDPDDGYRSCLGEVVNRPNSKGIFHKWPLGSVRIETVTSDGLDGWRLVAPDGHVWLELGTDYRADYYPEFVFRQHPRKPKPVKAVKAVKAIRRAAFKEAIIAIDKAFEAYEDISPQEVIEKLMKADR